MSWKASGEAEAYLLLEQQPITTGWKVVQIAQGSRIKPPQFLLPEILHLFMADSRDPGGS